MTLTRLQKFILVPLLVLTLLGPIFTPFAESFSFPDRYDLVAVLVEQGLYSDVSDYDGLVGVADGPISRTNIKSRVDRYATDVQTALPGTRALIIQVDRYEKPENVAAVLERFYFDGDPDEPTRTAYLRGVVIIGEVPLPVVNKAGNRFISLFPYTDFEQKAYFWNETAKDFEPGGQNAAPQPEIWHGVVRPPVSTQSEDGKKLLAAYLDKNHLYHIGDARYSTFNKRVFFQDFFEEAKNINPDLYKQYLAFLSHMDDVAYNRYTKELYRELAGPSEDGIGKDAADAAAIVEEMKRLGFPTDSSSPELPADVKAAQASGGAGLNPAVIPDIMTKIDPSGKGRGMTDKLMMRFDEIFTKYPNLINDFIKYTGRYILSTDEKYELYVDSAVTIIPIKDDFTMWYLKAVNTMVEDKIDEIVNSLQKPIPLVTEASIEVRSVLHKPTPRDQMDEHEREYQVAPGLSVFSTPQVFTNFSPEITIDRGIGADAALQPVSIYGRPFAQVNNVNQCSFYRGSEGLGDYSKLVEANHAFNEKSGTEADHTMRGDGAYQAKCDSVEGLGVAGFEKRNCPGFMLHAGCFYTPAPYAYDDLAKNWCFPNRAVEPVIDVAGTRKAASAPEGFDDFRSCFEFNKKEKLAAAFLQVDAYMRKLDDYDEDDPANTADRLRLNRPAGMYDLSFDANTLKLFESVVVGDAYTITLGDVLRLTGARLNDLLGNDSRPQVLNVPINTDKLVSASVAVNRTVDHYIPSVFYHKEPTNETMNAQAANMISRELPIDNPRYVTFQNQTGSVSKIVYPDIFKKPTLDSYVDELRALEAQINAVPRRVDADAPCNSCLSGLVVNLPEVSANPPGKDIVISRANISKIQDSIKWKEMNIDDKHAYISEFYLDPTKSAYIGESLNGYELAYFNGEGDFDKYEFSLNKEVAAESGSNEGTPEKEIPYEDDPNNPFDNPASEPNKAQVANGGYDLFSWDPPPVSPWWERMKEWAAQTTETLQDFSFGMGENEFYGKLAEENQKALDAVKKESSDAEALASGSGENVAASKITEILIETQSTVLVAGKKADVKIILRDKNGKVVNDEFAKLTLDLIGGGSISAVTDEDVSAPGYQLTAMSGSQKIGVIAPENATTMKLTVTLDGANVKNEVTFNVLTDAKLVLQTPEVARRVGITANGTSQLVMDVSAMDSQGRVISTMNGTVAVGLSDPLMGKVLEENVRLVAGRGRINFVAGKKKGKVVVNAVCSTLDPGQLDVKLNADAPAEIRLSSSSDVLPTEPGSSVVLRADLFDINGNLADNHNGTLITFRLTDVSAPYASLSAAGVPVANGFAAVTLSPRGKTGAVKVIASSPSLRQSEITIKSIKQFGKTEVSQMQPETLTAALLGIPAGDVSEPDYLGGWFVMNGKTQAATSLTTRPKQYKKLFEVTENGAVLIPETSRISAHYVPANNFSMVLRDSQLQVDIAEVSIFALKEGQFDVTDIGDPEMLSDGIYIKKTVSEEAYKVDKVKGALRVTKNDAEKVEVQTNGFTRIFDNSFNIKPKSGNSLVLQVFDQDLAVAEVFFVQHFNQNVKIQDQIAPAPGVYVKLLQTPPQIINGKTFSGNSSANPRGVAFYDKSEDVRGASAPGFAFKSLEDSLDRFGVGFTEDNKFALSFAAGEMFGEANRPFASDIGIVLGDPTVKVDNRETGTFSQDIGKMIYSGSAEVRGIISFDYNNDGYEDVLIVEGSGKIRLLQNNGGYDQLKDQGYLLDVKNGIQDFTKVDFNNDGQMDLVIAGSESCRKGETCVDIYENREGALVRRNLNFDQKEKIVTIRTEDLNNDRYPELVFADTAGNVKVLYNRRGVFESNPQLIGNVGLQVDAAKNLIASVLLRYPGMNSKNPDDQNAALNYRALPLREPNPAAAQAVGGFFPVGADVTIDSATKVVERDFIYADMDAGVFATSIKSAQDLNGGVVESGDRIRYTITLNNTSAATRSGVMVSDIVAESLEIDATSIHCADCGGTEMKVERLNGDAARPLLFTNITVPARGSRRISYEAIYKASPSQADKVIFGFNNQFKDADPTLNRSLAQDDYIDISVTKEGNPTGRVRYFYTAGINQGTLTWNSALSSPPVPAEQNLAAKTGLDFPPADIADTTIPVKCTIGRVPNQETIEVESKKVCLEQNGIPGEATGPPRVAQDKLTEMQSKDSDGDGLQDSVDALNGGLDDLAGATQAAVSKLTCDAGCIALPANAALFAPGFWSLLGVPSGYDIGLPVFGWGAPSIPPTYPPAPPLSTAGGRFYISPTLTGGVGFSLCLGFFNQPIGPPPICNFFSFGINALDLLPGN
ncbi:MAG: VCBS repeat-containing protein, partial [Patescibacteria group bacterium]